MRKEDKINLDGTDNTNKPGELPLCKLYDIVRVEGRIEKCFQQSEESLALRKVLTSGQTEK